MTPFWLSFCFINMHTVEFAFTYFYMTELCKPGAGGKKFFMKPLNHKSGVMKNKNKILCAVLFGAASVYKYVTQSAIQICRLLLPRRSRSVCISHTSLTSPPPNFILWCKCCHDQMGCTKLTKGKYEMG